MMGIVLYANVAYRFTSWIFHVLYALICIFKVSVRPSSLVKAPRFHVRERGTFSTIWHHHFLFALFAFDWDSRWCFHAASWVIVWVAMGAANFGTGGTGVNQNWWIFFIPSLCMAIFWVIVFFYLRDTPGRWFPDFEQVGVFRTGAREPITRVLKNSLTSRIVGGLWH